MHEFTMPRTGETMEEGTVIAWLKKEGESVRQGEPVVEIETDKAVVEVESPQSGILRKILCLVGETVSVHTPLALIGEEDEAIPSPLDGEEGKTESAASLEAAPPQQTPAVGTQAEPAGRTQPTRVPASPAARNLAAERGIELESLARGSGPGGRILTSDVEEAPQTAGEPVRRPMSRMRKAIARSMTASKTTIPHFSVRSPIDAEPLLAFLKEKKSDHPCTVNDIILLACGKTVREFPAFRSRLDAGDVTEFPDVDIGIAVGTDDGLLVPTMTGVDRMTLAEVAAESARIIDRARQRKMEIRGQRTFSVTNLGMFGVDEFSAIIFPPDVAVLAVGAIRDEAVVDGGILRPGKRMTITLTCDHRIIDGVLAAKFLASLKGILEAPESLPS